MRSIERPGSLQNPFWNRSGFLRPEAAGPLRAVLCSAGGAVDVADLLQEVGL